MRPSPRGCSATSSRRSTTLLAPSRRSQCTGPCLRAGISPKMRSRARSTWPPSKATAITPDGSPSSTSRSFLTAPERRTSRHSSSSGRGPRWHRERRLSAWTSAAQRWLPTLASLISLALTLAESHIARGSQPDPVMVDVAPEAAPLIDSRATARLVALETADVDVPPPPGASFRPPLYFRIRPLSAASLRVELWELGQPYGARSVSAVGSNTLKARRIALAAAELARQLRQRRLAELRAARHAPEEDQGRATKRAGTPIYGRLGCGASARGASLGAADVWLLGPAIEATLHFSSGQRLSLGAAWLAGSAPVLGSSSERWLHR